MSVSNRAIGREAGALGDSAGAGDLRLRPIHAYRLLSAAASLAVAGVAAAGEPILTDLAFLPGDEELGPAIYRQQDAQIAPGGPGYLLVWTDERSVLNGQTFAPVLGLSGNMLDIYGQILDAAGNPVGGPIVISNEGRNQSDPAVAWNGSAWFVAFAGQRPDWYFEENVYGVRVAADGTVLDPDPLLLVEAADGQGAYYPAVSSDGENWLVVCRQPNTIRGRRVAPDGSLPEAQPADLIQLTLGDNPDVAFADGVYLVAAQSHANDAVWFQRFDPDLSPLGALTQLAPGVHDQRATVASNGSRFMVLGLNAHRIETDGQVLDPAGIVIAPSGYRDVAWTGDAWAISSRAPGFLAIGVQRIANDGSLIDPQPIEIATDYDLDYTAIAGSGAGDAQVTFRTHEFTLNDVKSVRVDTGGAVSALQTVSIGLPRQAGVRFAHRPGSPGTHLAVFAGARAGESRILARRLSEDGTRAFESLLRIGVA